MFPFLTFSLGKVFFQIFLYTYFNVTDLLEYLLSGAMI